MKKLPPLACTLGLLLAVPAGLHAAGPNPYKQLDKSVSASGQFVVYSENVHMRLSVAAFCEETKAGIQDFIGETDSSQRATWKIPIVVNLQRPEAVEPNAPLSRIQISNIEGGGRRIELDVILRGDLAQIHFQQQIVHCILLEMEYRDKGDFKPPTIDPPEWLVEGLCAFLRSRTAEIDSDIYKTLLANGDLPTLKDFLGQATPEMNETTLRLYQAYSFGFVQLLQGLRNGPAQIAQYIHDLPLGSDSPSDDLLKHFPALGGSPENLEKWWTLSMARLAASDRYKSLSIGETDQKLTDALKFKIPTDKTGKTTKDFTLEDYKDFIKNPQAQPVISEAIGNLKYLSTQSNPLFRPIVSEYIMVLTELQDRKAGPVGEQLKEVAKYRELVLKRMDQIADYLNWFEATQTANRSHTFDDYLRSTQEFSNEIPKRTDSISKYLDGIEVQMQ